MQEITKNDPFGHAIAQYSKGLALGVEIGGGTGDGSTQCFKTKELFSLEVHPDRIGRHQFNMDSRQGGLAIHQLSSDPMKWMSVDQVTDFYYNTKTKLNQYSLEEIIEWHKCYFLSDRQIVPLVNFLYERNNFHLLVLLTIQLCNVCFRKTYLYPLDMFLFL